MLADGRVPGEAHSGEQADGARGDKVEVQAGTWGDLFCAVEVLGLGL